MRRLLLRLLLAVLVLTVVAAGWIWAGLPSRSATAALAKTNPGRTQLMLQREAEAREKGRQPRTAQTWVPLSAISRHLIHAVLSSEDQRFFGHEGVDWEAVQKSLESDLQKRRFARGGSTITQQLAKNLYFGSNRTLTRKARELIVTQWLEADLTKPRILALYLNVIEWGDGVYGAEAAARHWYGKSASALSPSEAAGLAAMIPNPRTINPRASLARHQRATRRVLWLMGQAGYLGRDAAGVGAEPPAEVVAEDEEPPEPDVPGTASPPSTPASPEPSPSPTPTPTRSPEAP